MGNNLYFQGIFAGTKNIGEGKYNGKIVFLKKHIVN